MITAAISTIALVMALGPQLHMSLQAMPAESELVDPATTQPDVIEPRDTSFETPAEKPKVAKTPATVKVPPPSNGPVRLVETQPVLGTPDVEIDPTGGATLAPTATPVQASPSEVTASEWPANLDAAKTALSAAKTAQGKFIQTNADGSITNGSFSLSRPGKMRFDYDDPTPILIVSDGATVAMEDSALETVDRIPLASTPLGLILNSDLDFDTDVDVLDIRRNDGKIGIRVSDATGELDGTLTMVFDAVTYDLLGWLTVDGNLQTTVVDLVDVETNVRIDPRLFRLNEEDDEEDER
jgi:outer membrane lipoprotein-sorting protein